MKMEPDLHHKRRRPQPTRNANVRGNLQGNGKTARSFTKQIFMKFSPTDSDSNDNSDVNAFISLRSQPEVTSSSGKMQFNFLVELGKMF